MLILMMLLIAVALLPAQNAPSQPPQWQPKNLQHFPKDIPRDELVQRMREFSFALGVRCEYCHAVVDGTPADPSAFASDEKAAKLKARAMLRMVDQINGGLLTAIPSRAEPRVAVDCVTCHRGLPLPKTLQTTLLEIVARDGATAAVTRYRELRRDQSLTGRYNFGEWEINELARRLRADGKLEAAMAILEMNGEFYPKSAEIDFQIAEMHLARGERDKALARYQATIAKAPNHEPAKRRIAELQKQ